MSFHAGGESFIEPHGWFAFGALVCDFCAARYEDELCALAGAFVFAGWSGDTGLDRHMCRGCRERAAVEVAQ
jgi:hypothetical protein